jgi:hypothetical protein
MSTYTECILPLLHRMSNLEQLSLWLSIEGNRFLTGTDLDEQILLFLPQLITFDYRISTGIRVGDSVNQQNDDIQSTFPIGQHNKFEASCSVVSYPDGSRFCYIISQPYTLNRLEFICQQNLPSGIFASVRFLMLYTNNQQSFEHQFFVKVSQSFPCLERLYIIGTEPQLFNNQTLPLIEFLYLKMLIFDENIHLDYILQFLTHTKTHLPKLDGLQINYEDLTAVTHVFTNTEILVNCARVTDLYVNEQFVRSTEFNRFFPSLYTIYTCVEPLWYSN